MSWLPLVGPLLYATALFILPGLLIAVAINKKGFDAFALAPVLSVSAISLGGIIGGFLHIPWGWWTAAATAVVLALAGHFTMKFTQPAGTWTWDSDEPPRQKWLSASDRPLWIAFAFALVVWARILTSLYGRVDAFPQNYDNVYHMSLIRYFAQSGTGSSLAAEGVNGSAGGFYPAAFHDVASLVLQAFPANLPMAETSTIFAFVAVAWSLGSLMLANRVAKLSLPAAIVTAIAFTALPAYPIRLLDWGSCMSNALAVALLPATIALVIDALGLSNETKMSVRDALVLGALAIPGAMLAQPGTVLTNLAIFAPAVLVRAWRQARRGIAGDIPPRIARIHVASGATLIVVFAAVWVFIHPPMWWGLRMNMTNALGEGLINGFMGALPAYAISILMLVGLYWSGRRKAGWLAWGWLVLYLLWLVTVAFRLGTVRNILTQMWYGDAHRIAAHLTILVVPLAALGASVIFDGASKALSYLPRFAKPLNIAFASLMIVTLMLNTYNARYLKEFIFLSQYPFKIMDESTVVTTDEYELIKRLPAHVAPQEVVATSPWNGSSLAYALANIKTTTTTQGAPVETDPDQKIIRHKLADASSDPAVCDAVRRMNVRYALYFGEQDMHGLRNPYPGLDNLPGAPGFTEVDREGAAVLYKITACWS